MPSARGAHARGDDQEPPPAVAPDAGDFERRCDHPVHARAAGEPREPPHLRLDAIGHPDASQIARREAREHRDGEDLRAPERLAAAGARHLRMRALHHLEAA